MQSRLLKFSLVLVVLLAGAGLWFAYMSSTVGSEPRPDFAIADVDGNIHHASEYDGKLLLLNFWATWCAPCRKEIPMLIQAQQDYANQGLQIVGMAVDDPDSVRKYAKKYGINYPVLVDANKVVRVQDALKGGAGLPVSVLIDRNGSVRTLIKGAMEREKLDHMLAPYITQAHD